jgi:hypothetical protein
VGVRSGPVELAKKDRPKVNSEGSVIGCNDCGKPAALVGDESGKKNMCPWCIAKRRPHVMAMWAREFIGQEGGKASSKNMTAEQRKERARKAGAARWAKKRETKAKRCGCPDDGTICTCELDSADDGHVTASFTGSTCMSDSELANGIRDALKSQRISQTVRKAKVRAKKKSLPA